MDGAFETTGRFFCDNYERAVGSVPEACLDGSGLFWIGMAVVGVGAIAAIVVAWRVFL